MRYGEGLHPYHRRLYAWAACFPVRKNEQFVVAAKNFGRLRCLWPSALFLERGLPDRLDVPFAEEPDLEDNLVSLAGRAESTAGPLDFGYGPAMSELPNLFRDPVTTARPPRALDISFLERRGVLAPAWGCSVARARGYFDLKRWFPSCPRWWKDFGPSLETLPSVNYVTTRLTDRDNPAWGSAFDEYHCFLTAAWVEWLTVNELLCWISSEVLKSTDSLDLGRLTDGSGGDARLAMFRKMRLAVEVFPWWTVTHDVRRRDYRTKVARQVYIKLDDAATYGFVLRHPCGCFKWKPDATLQGGTATVKDSRAAGGSSVERASPRPVPRAATPMPVGKIWGVHDDHQETVSGGSEPIWPSDFSRNGAVALMGGERASALDDRLVPRGATAGALALAWYVQMDKLRSSMPGIQGKTESQAIALLVRAASDANRASQVRNNFFVELDEASELAVRGPGAHLVDLNAILGICARCDDEEEEREGPMGHDDNRRFHSRGSSYDGLRRD